MLNLAAYNNSPDHSTKGTTSRLNALCVLVNTRFQVLFHSPPGVLFTFPSQYCSTIGHQVVFRLGGWAPRLLTGFLVSADTLDTANFTRYFTYRTLTFFGRFSHTVRLYLMIVHRGPNPEGITTSGLASSAFARHYSRNLVWFLFLPLLRCFSSGGSPRIPIDSVYVPWFFIMGVPTFGNLRIEAYLQLPAAYRSLSRPSSAPNAKAFSICSSSLELPYVLIHRIKHNCSQFFIAWIAVCFILCSYLEQIDLSAPGKIVCFTLFVWRKNLISNCYRFLCFFPLLCLSCMSH